MIYNFAPHSRDALSRGLSESANVEKCERRFEVVGLGRADGPHRPIERFRFESLNRRIMDDPPYQACSVQSAPTQVGAETQMHPRVWGLGFFRVVVLQGLDMQSVFTDRLDSL